MAYLIYKNLFHQRVLPGLVSAAPARVWRRQRPWESERREQEAWATDALSTLRPGRRQVLVWELKTGREWPVAVLPPVQVRWPERAASESPELGPGLQAQRLEPGPELEAERLEPLGPSVLARLERNFFAGQNWW